MIGKSSIGIAAALAIGATLLAAPASKADTPQHHHNSNTLAKMGKAIQYTTRKDVENLSVDTHRAEGRKSVVSMRPQRDKAVVTPGGHKVVYAHRYRGHRHYTRVRPHRVP